MSVKSAISGFRRDVDEIFALLGDYAAWNDNPYRSTLRNILEVRRSRVSKCDIPN
jgi:hypothetical protein